MNSITPEVVMYPGTALTVPGLAPILTGNETG